MPSSKVVKILNPSKTQTLQLTSISGDSADFHPSFFRSKASTFSSSPILTPSSPGSGYATISFLHLHLIYQLINFAAVDTYKVLCLSQFSG